ncbi:MAG: hypothetical protein M0Z95_01640 [Actinomycetota bacterium]|jgi:hypothetical protein|nr:hypothetical protein [Actinomycetota bacterium]
MSTSPTRRPAGAPTGGQFAARSNPECEVELEDPPSAGCDPVGLSEQLRDADTRFNRTAAPAVYAEYGESMGSGRYPYIDDVVAEIAKKHDIPEELHKQLGHEVYLSSGQFRLGEMAGQEAALTELGYRPITEFEPVDGEQIRLPDGVTYRVREDGHGGWVLLPPGKRTHGVSLDAMVDQHRAYESAKERGQLRMDGPKVRMFASPAEPKRRAS